MFVIAEVIHGNVYLLDGSGDVWRISRSSPTEPPTMELIERNVGRDWIKRLCEPRLINWLRD